jgi:hypothetical protein
MAPWIKCTNTRDEIVFANLDNAVTLAQRGVRKETAVYFAGVPEPLEVKETPEDLISSSAAARGMRRTDIG